MMNFAFKMMMLRANSGSDSDDPEVILLPFLIQNVSFLRQIFVSFLY